VRRLLNDLRCELAALWHDTKGGWEAFFFAPADPTSLGLIRIATGLLAFWSLLVFGLDLHDYFGTDGWAAPSAVRMAQGPFAWSFWFLVPDWALRAVWALCMFVLASFTVGLFSRWTAVLTWVIVVSTVRRVPIALFGFDQIISPLALYLAVTGASGQAVSLDRFLRRWRQARNAADDSTRLPRSPAGRAARRVEPDEPGVPAPSVSANLALRLIQLHLVVIYAMAGLAKLQGLSWWTGMALWGTMTAGEFVVRDFTWLAQWLPLVNLLTHASLALELLYPVLIWIRRARPLVIAGVVFLHLGIAIVSPGLTEFTLAMLAANLAFVSGTWLRSLVTANGGPALRVVYDGACPRCRASLALITSADPGRVVQPIDLTAVDLQAIHAGLKADDCMRSMHVIERDARIHTGFDAVRSVARRLPLLWPLAAVGYLPGVATLGRMVYNRLAASRPRDVPCTNLTCGIHSESPQSAPRHRGRAAETQSPIAAAADSPEVRDP
jgi:predicted DCC family thiol-disulfide oxidoreductase YuxK